MTTVYPAREHRIPKDDAIVMARRYRTNRPKGTVKAHAFPAWAVLQVLAQEGAVGLRIYHGMTEAGEETPILVAYDAEGNDILTVRNAPRGGQEEDAILMEFSYPCPIYCGGGNGMNGGDE